MTEGPARGAGVAVRERRAGALAAVVAGATLLAAACGGSSTETNTFAPGATYTQALAFAKCMRANGVPQFPAPDGQGDFNNAQIEALRTTIPRQTTPSTSAGQCSRTRAPG